MSCWMIILGGYICPTSFLLEIHENWVATDSVFCCFYRPFPSCNWDINHPSKPYVHHPSCNWVVHILKGIAPLTTYLKRRQISIHLTRLKTSHSCQKMGILFSWICFCWWFLRIATTGFSTYSTTLVLVVQATRFLFEFRYTSRSHLKTLHN